MTTTPKPAPSAAPRPALPVVETLKWVEPSKATNGCWTANSILGTYSVAFDDGWHADLEDGPPWEWEPDADPRSYYGPSAAQAACQAHLESVIWSALVASPQPARETDRYDQGRRDVLNAILDLNPVVAAKLANMHEREADPAGRLPFDVVFWVHEVAAQLGIEPRDDPAALRAGELP